jgi:biopolymer transport protein TolR
MAIALGRTGRSAMSDMNITPMIDVLLVLLVIFMIAQPLLQKSIDVQLPVEAEPAASRAPAIVLEIGADGTYRLNGRLVPPQQLEPMLRQVYHDRTDRALFVRADDAVLYQDVVRTLDTARAAGVTLLGAYLPGPPAR